jgi:competence protein ComEC
MIRRHLTPALVAFTILLAACIIGARTTWWSFLAAGIPFFAFGISVLGFRPDARRLPGRLGRAALLALAAAAGLSLGAVSVARMSAYASSSFVPGSTAVDSFLGTVVQDSSLTKEGDTALRISLSRASARGKGLSGEARGTVFVLVGGDYRFSLGQSLRIRAEPTAMESPGPERWFAHVERRDVQEAGFSARIWELRADARAWLHRAVSRAGYPASALMEALIIGSREDVPGSLSEGFARTGSLHILALSGLHVTVIYGIVAGMLGFLRWRAMRIVIASAVLLFYQFLAGFMPSLMRATVMILIGCGGLLLDRDREPLNLLALSGIVLVLLDPFQVQTLSFQLSFLALAGILLLGPVIERSLQGRVPPVLLLPLAMSTAAQLATLPLVILRFGIYYPSGLLAGLALVPLTTIFLWAGLAWLAVAAIPLPAVHDLCARGFAALYDAIDWTARFFGQAPGIFVDANAAPWIALGTAAALACGSALLPLPGPARIPPWGVASRGRSAL